MTKKRFAALLCALLLAFACALPGLAAAGDEPASPSLYRVNDFIDALEEAEADRIDGHFYQAVLRTGFDLPVWLIDSFDEYDPAERAAYFYEHNDFGCGEGRDGLLLAYTEDTGAFCMFAFGAAKDVFDEALCAETAGALPAVLAEEGWGAALESYLAAVCAVLPAPETPRAHAPGMPDWYPADVTSFEDFHDENAPRVVDTADIFTDAEEAEMLRKIEAIQRDSGFDLVVFTDVSSYGLDRGVYAADFHQFNGYGFGEDYRGTVLFICMEPGNRGWWTAACGACRPIYDYETINMLDDQLEPYMVAGNYGAGVLDYLDNVYELYRLPEWYPGDPEHFVPVRDASAPRVADDAGLLTEAEEAALSGRIEALAAAYGRDVAIVTTEHTIYNGGAYGYAQDYCRYQGLGLGEYGEAAVLCIVRGAGGTEEDVYLRLNMDADDELKNEQRLAEYVYAKIAAGDYAAAAERFLDGTERMFRRGMAPKTYRVGPAAGMGVVVGFAVAGVSLLIEKGRMKTVAAAVNANTYLRRESFHLRRSEETFLSTHTTRTKIESSSSGGGGSSHSSGYRSSGGRSYSGGGRSF